MLGKVHWVENHSILRHHLSLEQVIELIKSEEYQEQIELIGSLVVTDKKKASELKNKLPGFTPAGVFEGKRTTETLAKYSGILHLDVDHIKDHTLFEKIKKDPYVLASFVSPSGNGLKVFYRTEKDKMSHTQSIIRLSSWFENKYNERCDVACKDLARLCYVSFDPFAYYNQEAKCVDTEIVSNWNVGIEKAIKTVQRKGIYFIPSESRNRFVYELARSAKFYDVAQEELVTFCLKNFVQEDFDEKEITRTIQSGYNGKYDLKPNQHSTFKRGKFEEIKHALTELGYRFRYNLVTDEVEVSTSNYWQSVSDQFENSIVQRLERDANLSIGVEKLRTVLISDFVDPFDPFQTYFMNLPAWDGHDYIKGLFDSLHCDEELYYYLERWLVALVANALDTDNTNHYVLVLVGPQSYGKTRWLLKLTPQSLRKYYYHGVLNPNDKDSRIRMSDHLIINLDELDSLDKKDVAKLKEMITSPASKVRAPYARNAKNYPRRASFVASLNNRQFISDTTGSRRFLILDISEPIPNDKSIEMDKVMGQALHLYKSGMRHYFTAEEALVIQKRNECFTEILLEEEYLLRYVDFPNESNCHFLSASEIIEHIRFNLVDKTVKIHPIQLGKALNKLGFIKSKNHFKYGYEVSLLGEVSR